MRKLYLNFILFLCVSSLFAQNISEKPEEILKQHRAIPIADCSKIDSIVAFAVSKKGCAYKYGTAGTHTFDCSGLMYYVYKQFGLTLPRSSPDLYFVGKKIDKKDLQKGDLVFFQRYKHSVGHVGMVVAVDENHNFTFIHASTHNKGVRYDYSTADYYTREYVGARRIFECNGDGMPTLSEDTLLVVNESVKTAVDTTSSKPVQQVTPAPQKTPPTKHTIYYKIKPGDTLTKIAKKYRVSVAQIKKWNHLKSDFIRDGQKLKIIK